MCDPFTMTGIALTVGSTVANTVAANRVQNARNDAMAAERIRQRKLDQEADAYNVRSQDRYQDFEGQQEERARSLGEFFSEQSVPEPTTAEALPTSTSNITVREEDKQRGEARDFTNRTGEALGNLRAFGDLLGGIGREQARDAGYIGQLGGFKAGSSGVLPYELEAANEKGAGLRLFGDILGGVGGVATSAGLSGGSFGPFSGATPKVTATGPAWNGLRSTTSTPGLRLGNLFGG